jgi:hypothetical protein
MGYRVIGIGAALAAVLLAGSAATARAGVDGLSFRAAGFFEAESAGTGQCEVPGIESGILMTSDTLGLWNTFGIPTIMYPPSVCGSWMQVQNVMTAQGITVQHVDIRMRIAGAGRYRQFVPTRRGFPTACRSLRRMKVFAGAHLFPLGTDPGFGNTGSGAPHVAFLNIFPLVSSQVIHCLREQYTSLPSDLYVSFPLVVRAVATGITDSGDTVKTQPISFTLTLRHLCGNGRIDDGESCDPNAPNNCFAGICDTETSSCASNQDVPCTTDADCQGSCIAQEDPMQCNCIYGSSLP